MSRRFGRNQKRAMRALEAELERQRLRALRSEANTAVMVDALKLARDTFLKIGWQADCDAVRSIDLAFSKLRGHYLGDKAIPA